ncbi:MAG: hypothetical protein Q9225_001030 [Loekoesia sp. 1 TL-2023]
MAGSRTAELSSLIATHTAKIESHLTARNLPPLSFQPEQPLDILSEKTIAESRQTILEATDELHALMLGPVGLLTTPYVRNDNNTSYVSRPMILGLTSALIKHNFLISLHTICHFDLATKIPADKEEISIADMASGIDLDESTVRRILRHAISYRIFCEPRKGFIAHTGASKYLAKNYDMRQWLEMVSEEMWPAATKGFNIAHSTERISFDDMAIDPRREERYAAAMEWFGRSPGLELIHIVRGFDWASLGQATVVDVGGSYGSLSIALCHQYPQISCIVQDRSKVIETGKAKLPSTLTDRLSFMEHNFFHDQPVKGAEVYILRWILHDWSDTYATKILRALASALSPKSKLLICEAVLPQPGAVSTFRERGAR